MKVKVLVRNPDEYMRETKQDIHKGKKKRIPIQLIQWEYASLLLFTYGNSIFEFAPPLHEVLLLVT